MPSINLRHLLPLALIFAGPSPAAIAEAVRINTGGENGAYHKDFCPVLKQRLSDEGVSAECVTSAGTRDNMQRVAQDPMQFGYGQLDAFVLDKADLMSEASFDIVRRDDVRECLFAFTKNKRITNYGELAVSASKLTFILPPEDSGSVSTFQYLRSIDPDGLDLAADVQFAADVDEAIQLTLADDKAVGLFVQFPDPSNPRFARIHELGGHIVPVIDKTILAQQLDGASVYFAQETQVKNARWLKQGRKVVTACTPQVLLTGAAQDITDEPSRLRHESIKSQIQAVPSDRLFPNQPLFAKILRRTRELTKEGAAKFIALSEDVRRRAVPMLEKAKTAAEKAIDAAKPDSARTPETQPNP